MPNMLLIAASEGFSFHNVLVNIVPEITSIIELIGIMVIAIGSIKAMYRYINAMFTNRHYPIKIELGNALALGLEFKMGAEILKTVVINDWGEIGMLGAIIVLRAFLALIIHYEIKAEYEHGHANDEVTTSNY
ncbi:MAG: DUF1622 domain-containing protein [Erysipelotrichaceae bacterium]